jgi:hypothetical protein
MKFLLRNMILALLFSALLASVAGAQEDSVRAGWHTSLITDFTLTQTAYSDSWVGGEKGNVSWVSNLNGRAERRLKPWLDFRSTLKLSFGQTLTQDTANNWDKPRKSTDLIDWENVAVVPLEIQVNPYAAFRLESQFVDASFDPEKRYFSPLKLTESAGLTHRFYERDEQFVQTRFGAAVREILKKGLIFNADSTAWSVEDSTSVDGGLESVSDVRLDLNEKLAYTGKLTLYKAFFYSKKDEVKGTPAEDDWKAIDVNWENIINASLSKIISVNLYMQFIYDKQVTRKGQFKQTLGIGFVFTLM